MAANKYIIRTQQYNYGSVSSFHKSSGGLSIVTAFFKHERSAAERIKPFTNPFHSIPISRNSKPVEHDSMSNECNSKPISCYSKGTRHNSTGSEDYSKSFEHNSMGSEDYSKGFEHKSMGSERNSKPTELNLTITRQNLLRSV